MHGVHAAHGSSTAVAFSRPVRAFSTGPGGAPRDRDEQAMCIGPFRTNGDRERGRMAAYGRRSDDGSMCTPLVVQESDGSWSFHGLGAPGVRVSKSDAKALAQGIVAVSR